MKKLLIFITLFIAGCATIPTNVKVVNDFDINRYMGTWYEVARYDHSFEKDLTDVTATYTKRSDGGIDVTNKGFNNITKKWKESKGKAYFVLDPKLGMLKVSFFLSFYAPYYILDIDKENYSYAIVGDIQKSYLWILSRKKNLDNAEVSHILSKVTALGFDVNKLIIVQ